MISKTFPGLRESHAQPVSHLHHAEAVGELAGVPREVLLAVGVLDVEPHDVHGDVVLVELGRDGEDVLLVVVVPAALVVGDRELGRERRGAGQRRVLPRDVFGLRAQEDERVYDARLGHPVGVDAGLRAGHEIFERREDPVRALSDVDPRLRGVQPEHAGRPLGVVAHHEGDGGVQRHRVPQLVLEHVEVVEAVGVAVGRVLQAELVRVLRDAVDVVRVVEREVHGDRL